MVICKKAIEEENGEGLCRVMHHSARGGFRAKAWARNFYHLVYYLLYTPHKSICLLSYRLETRE